MYMDGIWTGYTCCDYGTTLCWAWISTMMKMAVFSQAGLAGMT
jgi:hypothetical protein